MGHLERALALNPVNIDLQNEVASGNEEVALDLMSMKSYPEAVGAYQEAQKNRRSLLKQEPAKIRRYLDLLLTNNQLCSALEFDQKFSEAVDTFRDSLSLVEPAARLDCSSEDLKSSFSATVKAANDMLIKQGELVQASSWCEQVVGLTKELAERYSSYVGWQEVLATTYELEGNDFKLQARWRVRLGSVGKGIPGGIASP
jgi:tetratricopeptide (TPR) repeat protein